ncbi:acetyl-CoA carboxylase biotin carboxyl carrier protein subunit [Paludibacter sp. 221]|uniref:biotin/lipoyl-containing protein n=1 Tax=Paludibacter sp. 221 TaxID=2302939 RepID=UPI0013D888C1|nr:biotin/lipoyl-containing protein [Paludibacter sp. 221]NDV46216.1 acetyl-CoA carboxylase biotin carboxyl carrier protein subunit [Paludibacter sp. 221]
MKKFSFEINGSKYEVNVKKVEGENAKLEVNGTPYSVKIHQEIKTSKTPILVRSEVSNADAPKVAGEKMTPVEETKKPSSKTIKSPLPGSVFKVVVKPGDTFKEGDLLMVLESMKMENNILAETNGTIVKINAPEGKAVLQDEVLFEIE